MIDHVSCAVNNFEESLTFYDQTLIELGYQRIMTVDTPEKQVALYGTDNKPFFSIGRKMNDTSSAETIGNARGLHIAFAATSVDMVDSWYNKCIELGGIDNGAPGLRAHYHPGYYSAFIVDFNGWRIEAVFHGYTNVE